MKTYTAEEIRKTSAGGERVFVDGRRFFVDGRQVFWREMLMPDGTVLTPAEFAYLRSGAIDRAERALFGNPVPVSMIKYAIIDGKTAAELGWRPRSYAG